MRRVAVERIEIDALGVAPEGPDDPVDAANLAVGNRDAIADRGRTEPFAFGQHARHRVRVEIRELGGETLGQLVQDFRLGVAPQVRQNHFLTQDFSNFHRSETAAAGMGILSAPAQIFRRGENFSRRSCAYPAGLDFRQVAFELAADLIREEIDYRIEIFGLLARGHREASGI